MDMKPDLTNLSDDDEGSDIVEAESKKMDDMKPLEICKCNGEGPIKYTREFPPANFILEIQSFSSLLNADKERYESNEFESGGYNWKLSIYPTGDKSRNGSGYISLYLSISNISTLPLGWEVLVNYKLFVFDQLRDKYLTVQDNPAKGIRRFNSIKKEWGFAQLISLETFNQASNGYLVGDSCVFGAEVFVIKYSGKRECLSLVKEADTKTYTWKITNFSSLPADRQYSDVFKIGNFNWRLLLYSKGNGTGKKTHLSLYLEFLDMQSLPPKGKLYAEFTFRVRDQVNGHHQEGTTEKTFDSSNKSWGFDKFLGLNYLNNAAKGYLTNDTIIVEVQFPAMQ